MIRPVVEYRRVPLSQRLAEAPELLHGALGGALLGSKGALKASSHMKIAK